MTVLVTGASGFLGSHVMDAFVASGDRVRVLVRPTSSLEYLRTVERLELAYGDLSDPASLRAAVDGVDTVVHAAARVLDHGSRAQFREANVAGTQRLLTAAREAGVQRFVHVSSPSVVMDGSPQVNIDETTPYPRRFLNLYSETKAAAEQAVLAADGPGFRTCALRPRGIWGPRDYHGVMPKLVARMLDGRLLDISGGRTAYASMCHAANAAHACMLASRSDRVGGRAYFVADAEQTDVWAFVAEVGRMFGGRPPTRRVPPTVRDALVAAVETVWRIPYVAHRYPPPLSRYAVALLTRTHTYDTSAAARDFGFRPVVDQRSGLTDLARWVADIGGVEQYVRQVRRVR